MTFLFIFGLCVIGFIAYSSLSARIRALEDELRGTMPAKESAPILASRETFPEEIPEFRSEPTPAIKPVSASNIKTSELEFRLGGKIFTAVGVIAVLFGVGFFLRYAFENNLISPALRVTLGFIGSVICLGLGEWLRKKYAKYGQTLMGLGLGIAYLTWYATLHFYHFINSPFAFVGMVLVTAIGFWLSIRLDSVPLAIFSQIGGFLTPALVGGRENHYFTLFTYILVLDLSVLALTHFKSWRETTLVGIIGTAATFFSWFSLFHLQTPWIFPFLFLTLYFILFSITSLLRYVKKHSSVDKADLFILAINPALYALGIYGIIPHGQHLIAGLWLGAIGLIYQAVVFLIVGDGARERRYRNALAIIGSAFLAIAIPIAFNGITVLVSWAILAVALVAWAYLIRSQALLFSAHIITTFPVIGTLMRLQDHSTIHPWLNADFWSNAGIVACLCAIAWIHWYKKGEKTFVLKDSEKSIMRSFVLAEAYFLATIILFRELQLSSIDHVWNIAVLSIIAFLGAFMGVLLRSGPLRLLAYLTYLILGFSFMLFYQAHFLIVAPVWNPRFDAGLVLLASLVALFFTIRSKYADTLSKEERKGTHVFLFSAIHLMGLYLCSTEIAGWFNTRIYSVPQNNLVSNSDSINTLNAAKNASLSVLWTIYALALLVFGILKKSILARRFAILLFGITVLKAFLYDTSALNNLYRFVSFMTLGVLLLFAGYLYHRFRDRIRKFVS